MAAIFKTVSWQVDQLVNGVKTGTIQLPDLQRPFVWPATKVRDLFDSMYRGYPVGALMFWDVAAEGETHAIAGGASIGASHQIIDGQQRLTSLYAAIQGQPVRDEGYQLKSITISFNPFSEKFEVRTPALAKSVHWVEDISTCFASPLKSVKSFRKRYEGAGQELSEDEEDRLEDVFTKLSELKNYRFDVVHIDQTADKRLVADVFVRINSEGVRLKAADYILTWLSVFWPEGREDIERFARNSRMSPQHASAIEGQAVKWTPHNPFIAVENGHVVRAMVAIGQNRGRLQDAYAALQAKDRQTGFVDPERQEAELEKLRRALPVVTDPVNWTEFIHTVQLAGFRRGSNVTSSMNFLYSYVLFLLGRKQFKVDLTDLRVLIARWLFMSQLTSRYTGSSESQIQKDLDRIGSVKTGDAQGFRQVLDEIIESQLTPDFWRYNMPQQLITSGAALSPHYQCYLAGLNILGAQMFMLNMPVHDWMNPAMPAVKGMEGHHLFPRKYQEKVLGITDMKRINQAANYAPTDWHTNIQISDSAPSEYWPLLIEGKDESWLKQQMYWHALPADWQHLDYETFLGQRRSLMAAVTRDAFRALTLGNAAAVQAPPQQPLEAAPQVTLAELVEAGHLKPGDLLDPIDPSWVVDAVVTDDATVLIDGVHAFDSLDEAARWLDVTNMTGLDFWALESGENLISLAELSN